MDLSYFKCQTGPFSTEWSRHSILNEFLQKLLYFNANNVDPDQTLIGFYPGSTKFAKVSF